MSLNMSADATVQARAALPNAWLSLLGVPSNIGLLPDADALPSVKGIHCRALSTDGYAAATFTVLHQALQAVQVGQAGPRLDALASALQRLFHQCNENASELAGVAFASEWHPLTRRLLELETQRARTIADAVHTVWVYVRGRALGDVDQGELNAAWQRVWNSIAIPALRSNIDPARP